MRSLDKLEIICGQGGLNASKSPDLVRDVDLVAMESLTFEQDTWQKDGGATKFNSVAVTGTDPEIRDMHQFMIGETSELVCATQKNRLLVVGTGGVTKTIMTDSGSTYSHNNFVEGYNGSTKALYFFGGLVNGGPKVYTGGSAAIQLGSLVGTVTANSGTDTFTLIAHGLTNNTRVFFVNTGGALPGGLSTLGTPYHVVNRTADTFQVSLMQGGAAENITSNGTGTTTVHRSTQALDWMDNAFTPRWGFMHRGRMYAGGGTVAHAVYASVLNNHSDFLNSGTLYFDVYPGEGELLVGGISWRERAYLFKYPAGIYRLDDSSLDVADWGWKRVSRYVGAISHASIVEADDEVYFVSPDGYIHTLSSVQEYGDVQSSAVKGLEIGPYIRANTDFSKLPLTSASPFINYPTIKATYYAQKKKVLFAFSANPNVLSARSLPVNKVLIGIDLHRSNPGGGMREYQPFVCTRDEYESLAIYRDPTTAEQVVLASASNGFIYKLDQSARSKDSAGYMARFETKTFRPYSNDQNANLKELEVVFADGSSSNSVVIKVYINGTLATTKTLTDADRFMRLYGDAVTVKIVGENDTINSSFSIAKIIVRFKPGNWRKHQ
jgi:hypothetical protein